MAKKHTERHHFKVKFKQTSGFSLGHLHMGGISAGGQSVNGGTHEGGHRPYGGITLVDYIIN